MELNLRGRRVPEIPETEIRARAKKRPYLKIRPPSEAKAAETETPAQTGRKIEE